MSTDQSDLKSKLATALLTAEELGHVIIEIKDRRGIIRLKGVVESEQDRLNVEALAKGQTGVIDVINELRVSVFWDE